MTSHHAIPAWFNNTVVEGMQYLVALHLPFSPSDDTIAATCQAWVQALWNTQHHWDRQIDQVRLRDAFVCHAHKLSQWPAPKFIVDHMAERALPKALPMPPLSDKEVATNLKRLGVLKKMMSKKFKPDEDEDAVSLDVLAFEVEQALFGQGYEGDHYDQVFDWLNARAFPEKKEPANLATEYVIENL